MVIFLDIWMLNKDHKLDVLRHAEQAELPLQYEMLNLVIGWW